jgi:hypothetical protein
VIFIGFSRALRTLEAVMRAIRGRSALTVMVTVVVVVLLAVSSPAQEENRSDGFWRVQWHVVELPEPIHIRLEGYVYNTSPIRVSDVRLHVVERDRAAHAVGEAWGWVFGDVPAGGSAYFVIPLQRAADAYDVVVVSFDAVAHEAP